MLQRCEYNMQNEIILNWKVKGLTFPALSYFISQRGGNSFEVSEKRFINETKSLLCWYLDKN